MLVFQGKRVFVYEPVELVMRLRKCDLCKNVSTLLQQRDRWMSEARRQLDTKQLFFLRRVLDNRMKQGNRSKPCRQAVGAEQPRTEQLTRRHRVG